MNNSKFITSCLAADVYHALIERLKNRESAGGSCWLCGEGIKEAGIPVKKAVGDTFTDWAFVSRPLESHLCLDCAVCLTSRVSVDKQDGTRSENVHIRILGLWASELHGTQPKFRVEGGAVVASDLLSPKVWRNIYIGGWDGLALCLHPMSGQKHLFFRQAAPCAEGHLSVQYDETTIYCERARMIEAHRMVEELYRLGETKASIISGEYKTFSTESISVQRALDHSNLRGSSLLPWVLSFATK